MKYVAVVLASAMLFMGSCSKKNEQKEEVRKKDPHALRYDSLDWKADFKPMKYTQAELNDYRNKLNTYYKDFWVTEK